MSTSRASPATSVALVRFQPLTCFSQARVQVMHREPTNGATCTFSIGSLGPPLNRQPYTGSVSPPLIAVPAYGLADGRVRGWKQGGFALPRTYVEALRRAGAVTVVVTPSPRNPEGLLSRFDGLLLAGGGDIEPSRFGAVDHPTQYGIDPERDDLEISLVREALQEGVPTLAICRGAQVVNVALGGTLLQHLPDEGFAAHGIPRRQDGLPTMHDVKVASGSRLEEACGGEPGLACESHHHQGLARLGEGLTPVAWSEDGLVEAVEADQGWLVAVQWHPEQTARDDPAQQALFEALVAKARSRAVA